jgi:hypothetical protein
MPGTDKINRLRLDFEQAESKAQKLMAEKDEAIAKVRERYGDKLREANDAAAAAQKAWVDAEATAALIERYPDEDERRAVMVSRRLDLPEALS